MLCGWHGSLGNWAVISSQKVEGAQEVEGIEGVTQGIPSHWWATLGMLPRGRCLQPAPCNPEGGSLLRNPVQTLNTEATPKTTDWSQPTEADDYLPPSVAPETADWSQPE